MGKHEHQIQPRAVILEDDVKLATAYERVLNGMGYETTLAHKVSDARLCIRDRSPELILVDIELPDGNGLDLMNELGATTRGRFVVISGDDSQRAAIKSIHNRAVELLVKPVSLNKLRECLKMNHRPESASSAEKHSGDGTYLDTAVTEADYPGFWIDYGDCSVLRDLRVAASLSAERRRGHALITGEDGLDKTSIAQAVHYRSRRAGACLVVDCHDEQGDEVYRHFFGEYDASGTRQLHTGYLEQASGGTLVLENVHSLTRELQSSLMSFLDSGQFRPVNASTSLAAVVGVIGTTHDIDKEAGKHTGILRTDFMYRLAQVRLKVPALSQCVGDITDIASFVLSSSVPDSKKPITFSAQALKTIASTQWTGNIAQLRGVILDSLENHEGGAELDLVSEHLSETLASGGSSISSYVGGSVWEFERQLVLGTLEHHSGDRKAAAKTLGISLKTLYNRLNSY